MSVFFTRRGKAAELVNYVPWLESDGNQYIDMGWTPSQGDTLTIESSLSSGTSEAGFAGYESQWELYYDSMKVNAWSSATTVTALQIESGTVVYNQKNTVEIRFESSQTVGTAYLFCYRTDKYPFSGRVYSAVVKNANGELIRDLWPCYDPDGRPAMYDKVEKKYYYNIGSGEFGTPEAEPEEPQPTTYVVTLTGSGVYTGNNRTVATVTINGTEYKSAATVAVEKGTAIRLLVIGSVSKPYYGTIVVNGTTVKSVADGMSTYYDLAVNSNTKIVLKASNHGDGRETCYGTITVTTS